MNTSQRHIMDRSINFKPSIKDEFLNMSVGDKYNIWATDSYAKDISICEILVSDNSRIISFTQGGDWPLLICVVTEDVPVSVYTPTSLSDTEIKLESKGEIVEIQHSGFDVNKNYSASNKLENHIDNIIP